jgi:1,4-alpha-glucan branching enzyme
MTPQERHVALDSLARGYCTDPFRVLGPHDEPDAAGEPGLVIRAVRPGVARAEVVPLDFAGARDAAVEMERVHPEGVFEARIPQQAAPFEYRLSFTWPDGHSLELDDAFRFGPVLGEIDLHLLGEGRHYRSWEKLGAHVMTVDGVAGTHFAVWAPNADRVSVVGDFNGWDGRVHPMRHLVSNGTWEIFVPGVGRGERYKYEIRVKATGLPILKADPYARHTERPPFTASVVWDGGEFSWRDEEWIEKRAAAGSWFNRPMSIYEVHVGSWMKEGEGAEWVMNYRDVAARLVPYVRDMGYTHVELMGIPEHPFVGSWGYQVTGYFAPTSRQGTPEDFKWFVDECHVNGIGVIVDWVPGHFPRDEHGLARFDGTALYEHADPRQGEQLDWGTYVFNYGRNEVRNFLISNALFWLDEYHVDGLRVDAVASMLYLDYSRPDGQWVPNRYGGRENIDAIDFMRQLNEQTHGTHPGTMVIAEDSTSWPGVSRPTYTGGLGFTYKWNMGWMHDIIEYMGKDPIHRRWHHNLVTFSMLYAWSENYILPFSHDEVVHAKGSMINKAPGDVWQKAATLRTLYAYMYAHPGKKLLFMGGEFGMWREWSEGVSLPWSIVSEPPHAGIRHFVKDLNALYRREPSLWEQDPDPAGFLWIDPNDNENSVFAFLRRATDARDFTVVVLNFTPLVRQGYRIGVPEPGLYLELLNSDAGVYGGGNVGNHGAVTTEPLHAHGYPQSLRLTIPPLGALYLKWQRGT